MSFLENLIPKRETFLYIQETKLGIVTFVHDDISRLQSGYKAQIVSLLKDVIEQLEK